ncbi:Acid phosphatase [Hyphomicrobiales bacterium]|nr:Acid phosphatase [Hyphomicrobiales bacterium]CAH1666902.1 Acid phosphatase [Hyphomicrobiales bacterium]
MNSIRPHCQARRLFQRCLLAGLVGLFAGAPPVMARDAGAPYVTAATINLSAILPAPPPSGSPEAKADMDAVLALQAGRTSESVAQSRLDRKQSVFRFADVLGPDFRKRRLPHTAAFFKQITRDEEAILATVKDRWQRARPFAANPAVTTCVKRPESGSYPSSHAALGYLYGLILADLVPDDREALMARAEAYAGSRALCGVHYPSDINAGKRAAEAIFDALKASPRYQAALATVRDEIQSTLKQKSAR